MPDTVYVVMRHGMPVVAFSNKMDAIKYSQKIGGPGKGHAIGFVGIKLFSNLELPLNDTPEE